MVAVAQSPKTPNPFIPVQPLPPRQFILEEYTTELENPTGILPIAKSDVFESFLTSPYSQYGFKFDTVLHWGHSNWYFPKHGLTRYSTCGEFTHKGCLNPSHEGQAYIRPIKHNCKRAGCPVCGDTWIIETTKKIAHRINEAEGILIKRGYRRHRAIHVTVNPGPEVWEEFKDIDSYNKLRLRAQKLAKRAGFWGGSLIFHPYRERCADCGGQILFKQRKCTDCGSDDIAWYWSPHFHLFGFGWITGTKHIAETTGWLVKNHGIRSSIDATAYYQLTHCGIHEGKHTVSWFGLLHYSKMHIPPPETEVEGATECPICGNRLRLVRYTGTKPPPINEEGEIIDSTGWSYRHG